MRYAIFSPKLRPTPQPLKKKLHNLRFWSTLPQTKWKGDVLVVVEILNKVSNLGFIVQVVPTCNHKIRLTFSMVSSSCMSRELRIQTIAVLLLIWNTRSSRRENSEPFTTNLVIGFLQLIYFVARNMRTRLVPYSLAISQTYNFIEFLNKKTRNKPWNLLSMRLPTRIFGPRIGCMNNLPWPRARGREILVWRRPWKYEVLLTDYFG